MLTAQEREFLREAAWDSIRSALEERPPASGSPREGPLLSPGSAFVTLRAGGRLRHGGAGQEPSSIRAEPQRVNGPAGGQVCRAVPAEGSG